MTIEKLKLSANALFKSHALKAAGVALCAGGLAMFGLKEAFNAEVLGAHPDRYLGILALYGGATTLIKGFAVEVTQLKQLSREQIKLFSQKVQNTINRPQMINEEIKEQLAQLSNDPKQNEKSINALLDQIGDAERQKAIFEEQSAIKAQIKFLENPGSNILKQRENLKEYFKVQPASAPQQHATLD